MWYALDSKERNWMSQVGGNFTIDADNETELNPNNVVWGFNTQKFYSALDSLCLCQFAWGECAGGDME
jgi:aldehyde:ferredoxin oxidoreductase